MQQSSLKNSQNRESRFELEDFARRENLGKLEKILGYRFRSIEILDSALTHPSAAHEQKRESTYERMEMLGDSLLGFVITDHIFRTYPEWKEGRLTEVKGHVVSEASLARAARKLGLAKYLRLGRSLPADASLNESLLADAFEALLGAIYIDSNLEVARSIIIKNLAAEIRLAAMEDDSTRNYKSLLQEWLLRELRILPRYKVFSLPDGHSFAAEIYVGNRLVGRGNGRRKQEAERTAAREAYMRLVSEHEKVEN